MKGYFEYRGQTRRLDFDPITKEFVSRTLPHPFAPARDPLELHLLADLGIDANVLERGELRLLQSEAA